MKPVTPLLMLTGDLFMWKKEKAPGADSREPAKG
jgi:hypothetical protein